MLHVGVAVLLMSSDNRGCGLGDKVIYSDVNWDLNLKNIKHNYRKLKKEWEKNVKTR